MTVDATPAILVAGIFVICAEPGIYPVSDNQELIEALQRDGEEVVREVER